MVNILALETSTEACSVAISKSGVISCRYKVAPRQHANCLRPMVEELLLTNNLKVRELNLISYGIGPGSFTGLRIGASAAQALAFSLKVPVFGGCTLEAQALNALYNKIVGVNDAVLSVIDAKIKKVFWSLVLFRDDYPVTVLGPKVTSLRELPWSEIISSINHKTLQVVGDAAELISQHRSKLDKIQLNYCKNIRPHAIALLKAAELAHQRDKLQDARDINPLYLDDTSRFRKMSAIQST